MTNRKRNILVVLTVLAFVLILCATLLTACKNDKGGENADDTTAYGEITIVDGGSLKSTYSLEIGADVYAFMQDKIPEKEHAEFAYWTYEGEELTQNTGLIMGEGITLTAVYKTEITLEVYAENISGYEEWQDGGDYTHMKSLDSVRYAMAGTSYTATAEDIEGLTEDAGKNTASARTITVSGDYEKNIIPLYYTRNAITVRRYTNYPQDTGLYDSDDYDVVSTYFGYPVELPAGFSCDGYMMLGWSSTQRATSPDYEVDSLVGNLMVWNDDTHLYEMADITVSGTVFYPTRTIGMYVVWGKGYTNLFGGGDDVVYVLKDDAESVYLYRGGYMWESAYKLGSVYWFTNYQGKDAFGISLSDNYVFTYYDENRVGTYYRYDYEFDDGALTGKKSSDYIVFSETDEFIYYTGSTSSRGVYRTDETGYITLIFQSGAMSGEEYKIGLAPNGDDTVFMFWNEEEVAMGKLLLGVTDYDGEYGPYKTVYSDYYYYFSLDGFHNCTYYDEGYIYTYYYWLDGDTLYLYYLSSSVFYDAGIFKAIVTDVYDADYNVPTGWYLYYEEYDGTFDVYDSDGTTKLGTVTCDGFVTATFTPAAGTGGTSWSGTYSLEYDVLGYVIYIGGTGTYENSEYSRFLLAEDDNGDTVLELVLETYVELELYTESGFSYDLIVLDYAGPGTAEYVVVAYDYYYYGNYITVMFGTYETYESDEYPGMTYYVFTVDVAYDWTDVYDYYIYLDYSYFGIAAYTDIAEIGFIADTVESSYGYTYPVEKMLWYTRKTEDGTDTPVTGDEEEKPWAGTKSVTFFEEYEAEDFTFSAHYGVFETDADGELTTGDSVESGTCSDWSGTLKIIMLDEGTVYGVIETEDGAYVEYLNLSGSVYGIYDYTVMDGATAGGTYEVICLKLELTADFEYGEKSYWLFAYGYAYVSLENDSMTVTDEIPVYVFEFSPEDGLSGDSYLSYNGITGEDEEKQYTYFDGENTVTGTVTTKETAGQNEFGYEVRTFAPADGSDGFDFVIMYYGNDEVFVMYTEAIRYTGDDGSSIVIDPVGYRITYTDASGNDYTTTYSNYEIISAGEGTYIQIVFDFGLVVADIKETTGDDGPVYTLRGWEFGEYQMVDNLLSRYVVELDGYGNAIIYTLDMEKAGEGTYEMEDTYISLNFTVGEDGAGQETYTVESELDFTGLVYTTDEDGKRMYRSTGNIYVNGSAYSGLYINYIDMSVLELNDNGRAVRYRADGETESGTYTWLDDSYFYYGNDDGTFGSIYRYRDVYNVSSEDYSSSAAKYFTSDLSKYFEFTTSGRVTFDNGDTYYYYTVSGGSATVYYVPSESEKSEANAYGYMTYSFGQIGEKYTSPNTQTVYYNVMYNKSYVTLERVSGEENKYTFNYLETDYRLGNMILTSSQMSWESAPGTISMYSGSTYFDDFATTVFVNEDTGAENGISVHMLMYTSYQEHWYYYFYTYDMPYYIYDITVDLEHSTYSITGAELSLDTYMYEYLYYLYNSSAAAYDYYSYITLSWSMDENGVATNDGASGYILPFERYEVVETTDENGKTTTKTVYQFELDGEEFTYDEDGYFYITFTGADGINYDLEFFLDFSTTVSIYYGVYAFVVVNLWSPESFVTEDDNYKATIGYVEFSYFYVTGAMLIDFRMCYTLPNGTYVEESLYGLVYFILDGKIYFVEETEYGDTYATRYYELTFTEDGEGGYNMAVDAAPGNVTSYYTDAGDFVDLFTHEDGTKEIILVYFADEDDYYIPDSCESGAAEGEYVVEIYEGWSYTIVLTDEENDGETTHNAVMTEM